MTRKNLKIDLKRFSKSEWIGGFTKQLNSYEKKVTRFVNDLDLKTREARERSKKHLDRFADHVQKTRDKVEKKIVSLLNQEAKRLNQKIAELFNYLKPIAKDEKLSVKPVSKKVSKKRTAAKATRVKKAFPKKDNAASRSTIADTSYIPTAGENTENRPETV